MVEGDKRDVTVLVLGRPGQTSRRFRFNRRAVVLLVLAILGAGLGLGYVLGSRHAVRSPRAPIAGPSASATAPPATRAQPARPPATIAPVVAAAPAAVDAGALSAQAPAQPVAAAAAPSAEGAGLGEPLLFVRDGQQGEQVIEVHPFAADGSPRASDFALLEAEMACGSGHSQQPEPELVRVLLAVHRDFGKPLVLIGGRCPAHADHPDTAAHHRAGRAVDLRLRGVSSEQLMTWLVKRGVGGAGRYKRAGFVHLDLRTGPREHWQAEEPLPERAKAKQPEPQPAAPSDVEEAPTPAVTPEVAAPTPAQDSVPQVVEN